MRLQHLPPVAGALLALAGALASGALYSRSLAERHVHALAPQMFAQKNRGAALQRAAFRQTDLLPIYGSSDLNLPNPYHASAIFRDYPSGFTIFPVGDFGSSSLIWLEAVAAVGSDLRGRKIAVSLSARPFLDAMAEPHAYAANFSRLQANELVFGSALGYDLRREAARRMLQYPATFAGDPLLRFALERLADGSPVGRLLYYASLPLGKLQSLVLRLQDHWESLVFLDAQPGLGPVRRAPAEIAWTDVLQHAAEDGRQSAGGNPFGFDRSFWAGHAPEIAMQKGVYGAVRDTMERSAEWTDLELLLRAIRELGGEALILCIPINEAYYDHLGVPADARRLFHERLRATASRHGATLVDFADGGVAPDPFTVDPAPHLSDAGWVHYARALDDFFHGRKREAL